MKRLVKSLDIIVVAKIDEGVIAKASVHVDQVDDLDLISLGFQQSATIPEQFTLGVQDNKTGVGIENIDLGEETGFTGTGATDTKDV